MGALGGDVCARVVESMWRWSLVDDRTLPVVVSLSAHFGADWHGHLSLTDCPHVSKQVLDRTARLWRNIATIDASDTRRLDLSGNSLLGDVLFPVLVESCPQLEARQQLLPIPRHVVVD
ncbi:uncharacterized protein ACA1_335960 [Acanthamoeba castellanii str. Neff]|uniref:Uncharacterized protein n=1 Tax=Acanthamoeba castellanii (strain ATCC 30010 / Neff) TaxID=1257118 RepID=L8H346_ACACF|nr:uncharacterized protein ACA1_335960 [Acanthamoeba castellanii str. Neff]ELR19133.1 hypothetical protein ACA1_335960 [Acanthamoeba castellanii str. Neff]